MAGAGTDVSLAATAQALYVLYRVTQHLRRMPPREPDYARGFMDQAWHSALGGRRPRQTQGPTGTKRTRTQASNPRAR